MELRALGPVEALLDGRPVDLGPPKQRALFALLLSAADRVVAVDAVVELLWAGEPPARATASLQAYVSRLRRALEPDRDPREAPSVLVTVAPGYVLRTAGAVVDVRELAERTARARTALGAGEAALALAELDAARRLWRGDPYADVRDAEWIRPELARLTELRLAAAEDRAEALTALGRPGEAAAELEGHVAAHPLRERGWQLLVRALYRAGRQGDALAALRTARTRLADELGVDPGPELRALEEAVLRQDPALSGPALSGGALSGGALSAPPARVPSPPPAPPVDERPFVGRADALAVLRAAAADAAAGRGAVVLVDGDPGIGKTRLVERFAAGAGAPVVWGRCPDHEVAPPLWPWEQVLRAVGPVARPAPEVAALLDGTGSAPAGADPAGARLRLYEAVTAHLAAAAPLVVVLDDLHWADTASLRLLVHLARSAPPLLVVATFRGHEASGLGETRAALARLGARRVHLGGLSAGEVRSLVEALVGADPGERAAAALGARTGGNPFFLGELVRAPGGADSDAAESAVPEPVREVVLRRVARLPEEVGALLAAAAVAGLEFDADTVVEVAGHDEDTGLDLLDSALAAGLVVEDADRLGRFRFAHALVRDALAGRHSRLRRARLHRRFGEVTARRAAGRAELAGEVARHWLAAAELDPATAATAVEHVVRAARAAEARLAHEDAVELWREALAAAELAGLRDRFELLMGLTGAQHAAGQVADGLALLDEVLTAAGGDPHRVVRCAVAVFGSSTWYPFPYGSVPHGLLAALPPAVERLADAPAERALGTAALGALLAHVAEFGPAAELAGRAVAAARAAPDPVLLARVVHLGLLATTGADPEPRSWAAAAELSELPGAAPELVASARIQVCAGRIVTGRIDEAEALLDRLEPELAALRSPLLVLQAMSQRAALLALHGELDAADAVWDAARSRVDESGHSALLPSWLGHRIGVAWQRGTLPELLPDLADAVRATGMRAFATGHALALLASGDPAGARRVLAEVPPPPRDYTWLTWAVGRLAVAVELGELKLVAAQRAELLPFRHRMAAGGTGTVVFGCVAGHLGEAALALGEHDTARAELSAAVEMLDRARAPYWAERARRALRQVTGKSTAKPIVKHPASHAGDALPGT